MRKLFKFLIIIGAVILVLFLLSIRSRPAEVIYGVSFSKFHADELKLDWKKVYLSLLDDLKVRNFRFSAHWPLAEPEKGKYNFLELDFQMQEAKKRGASVILAVGRRLPGWPECHEPNWVGGLNAAEKQQKILDYVKTTVNRYKNYENIKYWQVENEPFLAFFSRSVCGPTDEDFLKKEIALVRQLDPERPVLLTDSGEFGTWYGAYKNGDIFGTSLYLYVWWQHGMGPIRYPITPAFFRIKQNLVNWIFGKKQIVLIELSTEPWLLQPIVETPIKTLLERMGPDKFNEMISFAKKAGFGEQYLWGAEWWYYMKTKQNHPEFWERAKILFE